MSMFEDSGLKTREEALADYIAEKGYEIVTKPFSTNMGIDENGALVDRGEFIVHATCMKDGTKISCKLVPSEKAIYERSVLVKKL